MYQLITKTKVTMKKVFRTVIAMVIAGSLLPLTVTIVWLVTFGGFDFLRVLRHDILVMLTSAIVFMTAIGNLLKFLSDEKK